MKPDPSVPPSELFLKLQECPRPSEVIDFPRKGRDGKPIAEIRIQVSPFNGHDVARKAAIKKLKAEGFSVEDMGTQGLREVLGDAIARELLTICCLSATAANQEDVDAEGAPPLYGRIFRNAEEIGEQLTADELATLFAAYQLVQFKYGPQANSLDASDLDAWISRLEEGANAFPLLELPLPDLAELTCSLAERVSSLSHRLASLLSTSPPTSESDPTNSPSDTSSSGGPASERTSTASESSVAEPVSHEITLEQALRLARTY